MKHFHANAESFKHLECFFAMAHPLIRVVLYTGVKSPKQSGERINEKRDYDES